MLRFFSNTIRPISTRGRSQVFADTVADGNWVYISVASIGLLCHLTFALPTYQWHDRIFAWIPLVIFLFFLRGYIKRQNKRIPLMLLVAFQIYLFYSLPQFTQDELSLWGSVYTPSHTAVTTATLLIAAGELTFIAGYRIASRFGARYSSLLYDKLPMPTLAWKRVIVPYCFVGLAIYSLRALRPEYVPLSISFAGSQLFNIYLGLTLTLYLGHRFSQRRLLALSWLLAVTMAAVGFIQGMLGVMLAPFLLLVLAAWFWGNALRVRSLVLAVLVAIIVNPVKNEFRILAWKDKDVSSLERVEERLDNWQTAFSRVWIERSSEESPLVPTASRTSDLVSFAQAVDYVPSAIPFRYLEGLDSAVLFWVPRVIWPSKGNASDLLHNRYAIQFGYTNEEGIETTTIGASIFTEGYWSFGSLGVLSFLITSGLVFGLFFGEKASGVQAKIVCVVFIAPQIFVLQALTVTIASLFSFIIGIIAALIAIHFASTLLLISRQKSPLG